MARVTYAFLAGEAGADISYCYCRPGLLDYYRRLGARTYGAGSFEGPEGVELPLLSVLSDYDHYKRVGSPMAPWVKTHFGRGKRAPVDMSDFAHLFEDDVQKIVTDGRDVWDQFSAALTAFPDGQGFLDGLPESTLRLLMRNGFVMDVPEGRLITREGHAERELYIVLDGEVEVFRGDQVVASLGKGEVFGEMAFFRTEGTRWASVRATRPSRIAALRRRWVDDLGRSDPEGARAILFNLARVLAERAAATAAKEPGAAAAAG